MLNIRRIRLVVFAGSLILLVLAVGLLINKDRQFCMDVPIVADDFLENLTEDPQMDIPELLLNGAKITSGKDLTTLYISQPINAIWHSSELQGALTTSDPNSLLYFVKTSAIEDIENAVLNGAPLSLVIANTTSYRQLDVIITNLPVMYIAQTISDVSVDDRDREIMIGSFTLLGNAENSSGGYHIQSGITQWHIRGASSSGLPKKPYKLSLKDINGNNADYEFLGLGADDDWILNPMNHEDTKVREKFAMDFWNQYLSQSEVQKRMSSGEYVELVINNDYQGLYLLQRRIDQKYLQINRNNDILLKGVNTWSPSSLTEGYEIIYSPYSQEDTYRILDDVLSARNQNVVDVTGYIEAEVFLNYLSAPDNSGYKNMFYLLQWEGDHFKMQLIPWDTDMSMGVTWIDTFTYDYTASLDSHIKRIEHDNLMQHYPQLDEMIASYWQQSRKQIYTEENIRQLLTENIVAICNSGAYLRDVQKWGFRYGESDTHDALLTWCTDRLSVMDAQYAD